MAASKKRAARDTMFDRLRGRGDQALYVRINAVDTGLTMDDLAAVTPGEATLNWVHQVVALFINPAAGVMPLKGKVMDKPHLRSADRIMARVRS